MSQDACFQGQAQPRLNPPIYRWQEDMPESQQPQLVPPELIWLNNKNDIWMEIPRYEGVMWGGALFMMLSLFFIFTIMQYYFVSMLKDDFDNITAAILSVYSLAMWTSVLLFYKVYFLTPRDQPIRLNRKRQKIYTFDYKRKWWNPWGKWPTTIRVFNWADVHGELRFSSDRYTGGYQLFGSVCKPGTYDVIERFQIAGGSPSQLHQIWSYLCLYMKNELVPDEAVNPGRPESWAPRKANRWPAEMERESTTAPESALPLGNSEALPHK